jgi:tRNA-Thr(GGU) m(6)t(6)A37 methyltransferase TsaA
MRDSYRGVIKVTPVGVVRSPFTEKFGTPRQSGLVDEAVGEIELLPQYASDGMLEELEGFSHLWVIFHFDRCVAQGWRPRVRPPRLGGNREVGVWASRSPFRPNHLGLSVVRLLGIDAGPPACLRIAGLDMTDGTPVIDIKPYLPYADCLAEAYGGYADGAPGAAYDVTFSGEVSEQLTTLERGIELRRLIAAVIALDPRPAYREGEQPGRVYAMALAGFDVRWRVDAKVAEVVELVALA